jgi:NAD(P)-dependent dehydrogenase (short-subunit alcohol dehydrogenase family)
MELNFTGQVVVITGAGSGMGRAGARLFAEAGATLVLVDRDATELAETADIVKCEGHDEPFIQVVDLSVVAEIEQFATVVLGRFGVVDALYNNAGIIRNVPLEDTDEQLWDEVNAINAKAQHFTVRALLPGLKKSKAASVVNVSSGFGLIVPQSGCTAYVASKGASIALTRAQAVDLAPYGIRVNCIAPGVVDTPMSRGWYETIPEERREQLRQEAVAHQLIKRFAQPEEIASVALFLCSPLASFMTANVIPVDGGFTAV